MRKRGKQNTAMVITEALTLENASALRLRLLDAFSSHEKVVYRPDKVQAGSFGCVQLMHAAYMHASATGRQFVIEGAYAARVDEMFRDAGFARENSIMRPTGH